jgi:hypothetical protein
VPGYPDRILPKDDAAAAVLKKRALTNLYNARPAWLDHAHRALDEAVAEAYGWGDRLARRPADRRRNPHPSVPAQSGSRLTRMIQVFLTINCARTSLYVIVIS